MFRTKSSSISINFFIVASFDATLVTYTIIWIIFCVATRIFNASMFRTIFPFFIHWIITISRKAGVWWTIWRWGYSLIITIAFFTLMFGTKTSNPTIYIRYTRIFTVSIATFMNHAEPAKSGIVTGILFTNLFAAFFTQADKVNANRIIKLINKIFFTTFSPY